MNLNHEETCSLVETLTRFKIEAGDTPCDHARKRAFARMGRILGRPLRIGLFGKSGSGKSCLLNVLLRARVFPAGILGRIRPLTLVKHGEVPSAFSVTQDGYRRRLTSKAFTQATEGRPSSFVEDPKVIYRARDRNIAAVKEFTFESPLDFLEVRLPFPLLQHIEILEVPGNLIATRSHDFAPKELSRLDLAIWTTPAMQAWKRSEFAVWQRLATVADRSILVITHKDALPKQEEQRRLMMRMEQEAGPYFALSLFVSSMEGYALLARPQDWSETAWQATGFAHLEAAITALAMQIRNERLIKAKAVVERLRKATTPSRGTGSASREAAQLDAAGAF